MMQPLSSEDHQWSAAALLETPSKPSAGGSQHQNFTVQHQQLASLVSGEEAMPGEQAAVVLAHQNGNEAASGLSQLPTVALQADAGIDLEPNVNLQHPFLAREHVSKRDLI